MAAELTDERAAFETWVLKDGTNPNALERDEVGYVVAAVAACWEAWQARCALATQQATQGAEPVAYIDPLANEAVTASRRATWPARNQVRFWKPAFDTAPPPTAEVEKDAALRLARAHIKWLAFGECRADGWEGAPPTALEAVKAINAALQSDQAQAGKGE